MLHIGRSIVSREHNDQNDVDDLDAAGLRKSIRTRILDFSFSMGRGMSAFFSCARREIGNDERVQLMDGSV